MGTALVTFQKAQARAEYLCKLADGLVNTRKRAMRADWAKNFKKIMHWNSCAEIDRVDGRDGLLILRSGSNLERNDFDVEALSDLYRAALVMSVSAMDAYFHAKVLRYVVAQSNKPDASKSLMNFKITVSDFLKANGMKRRNSALRAAIDRQLSFQSLQKPDSIAQAANLIGVENIWEKIATEMSEDKKKLKKRIEGIVDRRNKIAHEGDVSQSKKTRNADRDIHPKFVKDALKLIADVVAASEKKIDAEVN